MAGLPHTTNSTAGANNYEPFYGNLFEVSILPPSSVSGGTILLEHVNSIGGLETEKGQAAVEQKYKFASRSYASGVPESTIVDITVNFSLNLNDNNELYVYKTLRDWKRLIYNPLTGEMGLKKDYVGTMVVSIYNRAGDIWWQRTFYQVFPTGNLSAFELAYETTDPVAMDVTFRSDWWADNQV